MVRAILSIIAGYAVILVVSLITTVLTLAIMFLSGPAFSAAAAESSSIFWAYMGLGPAMIGAMLGGFICALVARPRTFPPRVLAGVIFAVGLGLVGYAYFFAAAPSVSPVVATQPSVPSTTRFNSFTALLILHPFVGSVGVLVGAKFVRKRTPVLPAPSLNAS